ncbi:unnamed protein product [Adineta steineri]|uniref:Uncharacterized protein n=1 Tax=Adineta steineri TaxID=433720 RepID=A0A813UHD2_9BILA|nr:unnamed protein product [Adineta steineri]
MQYQRVLYTNNLTAEIKSKLGIVSIDKRLSSKKNVYFVSFASNADMKIADRIAKRIRNIALKPIQAISSDNQYEHRISIHNNQKRLLSSSTSPTFLSPTTTLSFLSNCDSRCTTPQPSSPIQQANETLEERAKRILGSRVVIHKTVPPIPTLQPSNFLNSSADVNSSNNYLIRYEKDKKQLIDNVTSCLKTMEVVRQAADHLCQIHKHGIDCREAVNSFFKVHTTNFYMKATTSAQIMAACSRGLRLFWSDIADIINVLKVDIHHQESFMTEVASSNFISSKIDITTSIAMSSKLAYQLTRLSR